MSRVGPAADAVPAAATQPTRVSRLDWTLTLSSPSLSLCAGGRPLREAAQRRIFRCENLRIARTSPPFSPARSLSPPFATIKRPRQPRGVGRVRGLWVMAGSKRFYGVCFSFHGRWLFRFDTPFPIKQNLTEPLINLKSPKTPSKSQTLNPKPCSLHCKLRRLNSTPLRHTRYALHPKP